MREFLDWHMKRIVATIIVAALSLSFLPVAGPVLKDFFDYPIAGTALTPGIITAAIGLYVAWLISPNVKKI